MNCELGGGQRQKPWWSDPWLKKLAVGMWNVTSLVRKKTELVCKVERFQLDIVRLHSTHSLDSLSLFERGWNLFHSGVVPGEEQV